MARLPCFIFSRGVGMGVGFSLLAWRAYGGFCYCKTVYFFILLLWRLRWLGLVYCWHVCHFGLSFLLAILLVLSLADFTSSCVILLSFYVRRRSGFLGRSLWREGHIQKQPLR